MCDIRMKDLTAYFYSTLTEPLLQEIRSLLVNEFIQNITPKILIKNEYIWLNFLWDIQRKCVTI